MIWQQYRRWWRWAARLIALAWAGWWIFFGLASGIGEGLDWEGVLIHTAVPGLVFLVLALLPLWREGVGGALLILTGLLVAVWYPVMVYGRFPLSTIIFVLLLMALPPFLTGGMCLFCWRHSLE